MQNSKKKRPPVTHVIFDCDNTLVNSIDQSVEVIQKAIQRWNQKLNLKLNMSQKFINRFPNFISSEQFANALEKELGISLDRDEIGHLLSVESRSGLRLLPGVKKLLLHLKKYRIPVGVATGATREHFEFSMKDFPVEITSIFDPIICADDEELKGSVKPDPECYRLAIRRFQEPPVKSIDNVLIFEDSITGIKGAIDSGAQTVLVTKWKEATFTEENRPLIEKVDLVLESLEEFEPKNFGLPSYEE